MVVQNVPEYAWGRAWWVARVVDGQAWFWGAYDDEHRAWEVAIAEGGQVVKNPT